MSDSEKTALTLGLTFPLAFLVGVIWCLCMTRTCGITKQHHRTRLRLSSSAHTSSRLSSASQYSIQQRHEVIDDDLSYSEEQGVTIEIPNEIPERSWSRRTDSF